MFSKLLSLIPTRTVVEHIEIIHSGPDFQSWVGDDGTYFKLEPLATMRDAREFFLAAYPAGFSEKGWNPIYRRLRYDSVYISDIGTEAFDELIEAEMADFTAFFYNLPESERFTVDPRWLGPGFWDLSPIQAEGHGHQG